MTVQGEEASDGPVLPHLQSVARISKIPIVESALCVASGIYDTVKESSSVYSWTFNRAENVGTAALVSIASRFETHIHTVDDILGKGIDIVEEAVPAIKLTPQQMLDNTRQLVATGLGLDSREPETVTSRIVGVATTGLSSAVSVVETYVNKYLPTEEEEEQKEEEKEEEQNVVVDEGNEPSNEQETKGNEVQVHKDSSQILMRLWKISRRMQRACRNALKKQEIGHLLGNVTESVIGTKMVDRVWLTYSTITQTVMAKDIPLTEMTSKVVYQVFSLGTDIVGDVRTSTLNLLSKVFSKIKRTKEEAKEEQQQEAINGCDSEEKAKILLGRQDKGTSPAPSEVQSENNSIIIPGNKNLAAQVKASAAQGKTKAEANVLQTISEKERIANN